MIRHYNGWQVHYSPAAPVTGRYQAVRHGVEICAGTESEIISMIDQKYREVVEERQRRLA